jgi:hypothetical protein
MAMDIGCASRFSRLVATRHFLAMTWVALLSAWLPSGPARWMLPLVTAILYVAHELTMRPTVEAAEAQHRIQQTADLNLATLEALTRATDAKDQTSRSHLKRMQLYASRLSETMGLAPDDHHATTTAALLHDIGELAVPEHILSKPGPLTQEEFQKVKIHPQVGAEIISMVPFPYPVAQLILGHHERWDGTGYPRGIAGEDIPIGARILSVVDFYDSVTTDRPYHAALSHESTVNLRTRYEAGKALEPTLVPEFLKLLPTLEAEMTLAVEADPVTVTGTGSALTGEGSDAFESTALAHREIHALYEIARLMGTSLSVSETMELISSKLGPVVPWASPLRPLRPIRRRRVRRRSRRMLARWRGRRAPRARGTS